MPNQVNMFKWVHKSYRRTKKVRRLAVPSVNPHLEWDKAGGDSEDMFNYWQAVMDMLDDEKCHPDGNNDEMKHSRTHNAALEWTDMFTNSVPLMS